VDLSTIENPINAMIMDMTLGQRLAICFAAGMAFLGPVVRTRFTTLLDLEMVRDRNSNLAVTEFQGAMESPLVGLGAGRACNATLRAYPDLDVLASENQFARIRNEGGLAGLSLFVIFTGVMILETWRATRFLHDPHLRLLGCSVAAFCLTNILTFPIGQPLDVPPLNFYFWFLLGLLHALVRLQATEDAIGLKAVSPTPSVWNWIRSVGTRNTPRRV
jgi:hypothetical protein